ncbi:MAG: sugar phosphate isomerase/epimerase [Oscillospiraceae bacterium]|nr:sugar phosphate isomerase/epimerase [Oscillospiraceae bacterium]
MKLSISNISWPAECDEEIYEFLQANAICGLEVAPTRIFPFPPYGNIEQAKAFANRLHERYGLIVSSMQSIWYGISNNIFDMDDSRDNLVEYTRKAIDFACVLNCRNLVFGCPKNRAIPKNMPSETYLPIAHDFFGRIGNYAAELGVCVALEPNPPIYKTNFINTTSEAFEICRKLNNPGVKVNVDLGTVIYNSENIDFLKDNIDLVSHIHISEPNLVPIKKRELHGSLISILQELGYTGFLSIEMANPNDIEVVKTIILYAKELLI